MRYLILLAVFFCMGLMNILPQQPPLIDRELFFGDPEISGAQISPDGEYISFRKQFKGVMNIWVKERTRKFDEAHPLTADTTRPIMGYFWTRDSKYILYVQDKGGDENYRVYAVDPGAKGDPVPESRDLTPLEKVRAEIIAVPKNTPRKIIIGLNDRDPKLHDVYELNLDTGERTLIRKNTNNIAGWQTDPNGNLKLGVRITLDGGSEILKLLPDTVESIYKVNNEEEASPLRFTPDGNSFYLMTNKGKDVDKTELLLFNINSKKTTLIDKDPLDEVDLNNALFSDVSNKLLATVYTGDKQRIYPKDDQFKKIYEKAKKSLPDGNMWVTSMTADEKYWVVSVSRDVDPGSVYIFNTETGDAELLYRYRPELNSEDLSEMEPVKYKASDGMIIHSYLTLPKGLSRKNLSVIMYIHGGPWHRDQWGYNPLTQFMANRGYAVFQPNFRGSTGYGKKYLNAGNKQWGRGKMQQDITDAVNYLIKKGIANPKKVAIMGGSYGGYATLAGLAFTPDLYAAGFDIVGPSNIITLLKSIPPYWAPIKKLFDVRVGDMNNPEDLKMLEEDSPLNYATDIKAPLYVVQGANDPRVNKSESDRIVVALRDLHRPVEYMVAPDEGHGFAGLENRLAMFVAMEKFMSKYLGGRVQEDVRPAIQERLDEITVDVNSVTLPKKDKEAGTLTVPDSYDGSKVHEGTAKYSVKINTGGREINLEISRNIYKTSLNDKPVWRIVEVTSGMMAAEDTLDIDANTLMPVRRSIKQGTANINLNFSKDSVKGLIDAGIQKIPVNVKLDGPVLTDGTGAQLAICSLPLSVGYKGAFNELDIMKGKTKKITFEVTGSEKVKIASGEFDSFKIELKPVDEENKSTMWFDKNSMKLVKMEASLPAQAGGGTIEAELME